MKYVLFVSLSFFTFILSAQDAPLPEKKIRFGVSIASQINKHSFNKNELNEEGASWGVGVNGEVYYKIIPIIELQSGFGFSRYSAKLLDYSILLGCDHNGSGGANPRNSYVEAENIEYFLRIPLNTKINFSKRNSHFFWTGGLALMFRLSDNNRETLYECGIRNETTLMNTSFEFQGTKNLSVFNTGVGYSLGLKNGTQLILSPFFEYAIKNAFEKNNSIRSGSSTKDKMISYGVRFGFNL